MPSGDSLGGLSHEEIRAALGEVLAWEPLRRSPQLAAFLAYVVEAVLRGDAGAIKAYSIAVDVLGRGEDFDPQADPIVRVQARRLRRLLSTFYAAGLSHAPVRIELPVGSYVPVFHRQAETVQEEADAAPPAVAAPSLPKNGWLVGLFALAVLALAILFWPMLAERTTGFPGAGQPAMPLVVVEEFENLALDGMGPPLVAGLALELVTDFNQFPDISARYGGVQAALSPADIALDRPVYVLSGVARRVPDGIQYGVLLTEGTSETAIGAVDIAVLIDGAGQPSMTLDEISRYIVLRLASPRGPLHRPARLWLAAGDRPSELELYPCLVAYRLYVERRAEADAERAVACARPLAPQDGDAAAALASLLAEAAWRAGTDTAAGAALLAQAVALADEARDAAPVSGFVWVAAGNVALMAGELQRARDRFSSALQLNPGAVDILAAYAHVLAMAGNWPDALRLSQEAMAAEPEPPDWYYLTPALYALREGHDAEAIANAERTVAAFPDISAAILVAAGGASRDLDVINVYLPRLLAGQRFRRLGILPALSAQISDAELFRRFSSGMSMAGVPLDRLARPF